MWIFYSLPPAPGILLVSLVPLVSLVSLVFLVFLVPLVPLPPAPFPKMKRPAIYDRRERAATLSRRAE